MSRWSAFVLIVDANVTLILSNSARAQTVDDEGLWLALFAQGKFQEDGGHCDCRNAKSHEIKWWFDGHARFLDDADFFSQSIVRPGIGYALTDRATIWAGYGWIRTSPIVGADFDENRIWQQLTWSRKHDPLLFAFRSRLEQRFVETGDDAGWRFRQLIRAQHNLPACPHLTLVSWDELFIHLNDTDWGARSGFNQNRLFAGIGLKCDPQSRWRTEIGYLNQTIHVPGGNDRSHHILSINFYRSP